MSDDLLREALDALRSIGTPQHYEYRKIADLIARIQQRLDTGGWIPIETAPKNGTLLQLLIDATDERENPLEDSDKATRTTGFNNFDNDGEDKWLFSGWCWTHDHFTEGHGTPTHWQPLPDLPKEK